MKIKAFKRNSFSFFQTEKKAIKGQFTADSLFAILATLFLVFSLQTIFTEVNLSQKELTIAKQEIEIIEKIGEIVEGGQAIKDGTFSLQYAVPMIYVPENEDAQSCSIIIRSSEINISSDLNGNSISRKKTLLLDAPYANKIGLPKSVSCGETLKIEGTK